ncbi:MAG: hypothetical protein Q8N34_14460 [Gammaproteobacteria bacterium]|nr:hypothetical protein [Gammaproteobacteria bacterium]
MNLQDWQHSLYRRLPANLQAFFQASARSHLLKQVNTVLMVHDERVYDLANGSWRQLSPVAETSAAHTLAAASCDVLNQQTTNRSVLLLLPPSDFIATSVSMPGVARENLRSALQLQAGMLLPSYEGNLTFAVNTVARATEGSDTVLWTDEGRLDALFEAFASRGLFLTSVMPRALAAITADAQGEIHVQDSDATTLTHLVYENGVLSQWLHVDRIDLEEEQFARQWQEATMPRSGESMEQLQMMSADTYLNLPAPVSGDLEYTFVPNGAQAARRQMEKGKRMMMAAAAASVVLLLGAVPFLLQSLQTRSLLSTLEEQRELSAAARADQAVVRDFEQRWGVLNEFPRQNIPDTLLQLQSVISPSVLTSLEIEQGIVRLEGESSDPQSLLERLEQNPAFTGVDFARATNNNRYYIDLRLSTVDFDGYQQRYFPNARR